MCLGLYPLGKEFRIRRHFVEPSDYLSQLLVLVTVQFAFLLIDLHLSVITLVFTQ
ncbi:hypothetical protein Trad_1427 [Truepera radiovictrix DSM 17093]|uniref:Uncharacterized protein n=1 Tax=Truepera radiovictrix (strain DSM 17093 / CIP 108686 / LMG 22925 / RQ-24) TaxID=649638 RepID=D7CX41_TRURR|nr:hypothetical protein Trad_1427 [Truepera radiovictrix DSM 17093]